MVPRSIRQTTLLAAFCCCLSAPAGEIEIKKLDDRAVVTIDGELFTEYVFAGHAKPILYPIIGPYKIPMTRNYPMRKDVAGEANDHPHHKSMWFAHGDVNGVSFWNERGKIVNERVQDLDTDSRQPSVTLANKLLDGDGNGIPGDDFVGRFSVVADLKIKFGAGNGAAIADGRNHFTCLDGIPG